MRRVCGVYVGVAVLFCNALPAAERKADQSSVDRVAPTIRLSQAHLSAVNRPRRIYVNNDAGYDAVMGPKVSSITPEAWIAARFSAFVQPGSQVDCVGWCLDEGNIAAYPSKVIPELQYPTLLRWRKEGVDIAQRIVEESHRRKIEVFWEHRLNGADREVDVNTPARHPVKDQHPEWLIQGSWWKPGLWNFAVPEVRKYKLAILREAAERYDLDGMNLDFGRHPPYLPTGKQWELREALTDFVRQTRLMLQEVAERRGRPFLLSVRVADTVPGCHFDGLDVEAWVRQSLVDMIIVGTRSIQVDLPGFRQITAGSHVKLYPCIDQHHSPDGYHAVAAPQFLRGVAANWRHQGADGIATFNFWNELPEPAKLLGTSGPKIDGRSVHAQVYQEIGDPKKLTQLDKWFVVSRRYGGGFYNRQGNRWDDYLNLNHQAPLPLTLGTDPGWVEVDVADDTAAPSRPVERLALRLQFSGPANPQLLGVKFNGIKLQDPKIDADWWTYALSPVQMAVGRNLLTVDGGKAKDPRIPISLEKVEVHVNYREVTFDATEHVRRTIYHSPQSPGYTCWCGAWIMPDNSLMVAFTQATGPMRGRPRGPADVLKRMSWPPPGQPDYDMTGLTLGNIHLRSRDSGKTWEKVSADAFRSCMNGVTGMAEVALPDGTVVRAVEGFQMPYNPEAPQTGYIQRSLDGTKTWGKPEVLLDPAKFLSIPKRLRLLKDGRLLLLGGFANVPAQSVTRHELGKILQPWMQVSADGGKSWSERIEIVPIEHRRNWGGEEFDAAELVNGDLLCVFRRLNPLRPNTEARWQGLLKKSGTTWRPAEVGPAPFAHSGHPELLATREGPILHLATNGIHGTTDAGKTWHRLNLPGTAYYPRSVQMADGRIMVVGHIGGDDAYGKVDQSIVMDAFRLQMK